MGIGVGGSGGVRVGNCNGIGKRDEREERDVNE